MDTNICVITKLITSDKHEKKQLSKLLWFNFFLAHSKTKSAKNSNVKLKVKNFQRVFKEGEDFTASKPKMRIKMLKLD